MEPALLQFMARESSLYSGKLVELREQIAGWLSYIPQTFPHYTRHTIEHSDKIVLQLSKLLFWDDDCNRPLLGLSSVEAYILCASAMLHDSGMVASDADKVRILESEEWTEWVSTASLRPRITEIESLRIRLAETNPTIANFVADRELRFLIAEFIRARHHRRSGDFLAQHELALGRFAFDDPILKSTIANICVAHGLSHTELADDAAFPLARDIRGEKVNVRLLAILLRLGDLLDMDADRACPLLSVAGGPVPSGSIAHWSQYRLISHRLTTPERIEIVADCESQDQHRVLFDWCSWIEAETVAARRLLAGSKRHASWHPPMATVGPHGSIQVRPSTCATYIPCNWQLHLDEATILDRLINDLYADRTAFMRELLQNAIDATRCKMYLDMMSQTGSCPADLRSLHRDFRDRYAVRVTISEETIRNEVLGHPQKTQLIRIDDSGIGMDLDIIQGFFLQVGRSFYQTPSFLRNFPFPAIGRHGIGFLSVFSVSDNVVVDTRHHLAADPASTRLTLTGPKNYFLRERGQRTRAGTTIEVRVREAFEVGAIVSLVENLCRRVEIPILVTSPLGETTVEHETPALFVKSERDLTAEEVTLEVRAVPFDIPHIRGELYIFERKSATGTSWADWSWANYRYASAHPLAQAPQVPADSMCVNGLDYASRNHRYRQSGPIAVRFDYRGPQIPMKLDRAAVSYGHLERQGIDFALSQAPFVEFLKTLVDEHLRTDAPNRGDSVWKYKQTLAGFLPLPDFWDAQPNMLIGFSESKPMHLSLSELRATKKVVLAMAVAGALRP